MDYVTNQQLLDELSNSKVNMITAKSKHNYIKLIEDKLFPVWKDIHDMDLNLHKLMLDGPLPCIAFLTSRFDMKLASRIRIALLALFIHTRLNTLHELASLWKHEMNKAFKNVNFEHCTQNMPSQKDMKALLLDQDTESENKFIDQDHVRKVYDELLDGTDDKLYLAFMGAAGQPPLRTTDCHQLHLSNGNSDCLNYIDLSVYPYKLILRDYKTKKIYKTKIIPLVDEICRQINITLRERPRNYLFINPETKELFKDRSSFGKYTTLILKRCFGKNFTGGRLLRHTYVSDTKLDFKNLNNSERAAIAHVMGNSEPTIQFNYLYQDSSKWNLNPEPENESKEKVDFKTYSKIKNRLANIHQNISKLKDEYAIPISIYISNPLCIQPLNLKGNPLPLSAIWNCGILRDVECENNNGNFIKLYKNENFPTLIIKQENKPDKEYIIKDENTIEKLRKSKIDSLCNYKNSQYYYQTIANILRDTSFFKNNPPDYSLKHLQNDIFFITKCENLDKSLIYRKLDLKTKKKRNRKRGTNSKKNLSD